jgi:hypothetical protein
MSRISHLFWPKYSGHVPEKHRGCEDKDLEGRWVLGEPLQPSIFIRAEISTQKIVVKNEKRPLIDIGVDGTILLKAVL